MRANGNSTHEILGKIVTAIASIAMTAAFAVPAMAASDSGTAADSGTTQQSGQYKIYPQPQNTEYGDGSLILRDKANTVVEPGIDSATKARLNEALKLKGIETTAADAVPETAYQLNVLVGINGSNGVVDKYAKQLIADGTLKVDDSTFSKNDSYVLAVRQGNAKTPDTILVLGRDTDSAFYGLTTLYQIFQQLPQLGLAGEAQPLLDAQGVALRQEVDIDAGAEHPLDRGAVGVTLPDHDPPALVTEVVGGGAGFRHGLHRDAGQGGDRGLLRGVGTAQREPGQGHPEQAEDDGKNA